MSGVQILTILLTSFSNLSEPQVAHLQNGLIIFSTGMLRDFCLVCNVVYMVPLALLAQFISSPKDCELLEGRDHNLTCVLFTQQLTPCLTKGTAESTWDN